MTEIVDEGGVLPRPFGSYTLLALLGRGGMGEVYLASRGGIAGIERRCVVKTLRAGFGDDHEYVSRFLDEARVVVQLHHRNICPVFDVGKVGVRHYLAMEYIAGRDLRTVAHRARQAARPLDTGLALHVLSEVLEALDYAHALTDPGSGLPLRLVHRDVSPHNVMIGFDGDTRLIDFGLAASTLKIEHTAPNMVMGKVAYMAPEQVCAETVDARADQFSAAVMGYELLVGERYYEGRPAKEVFHLAARGEFRPEKLITLPGELQAILSRALSENRDDRFPSCGAMREAIDAYRYANGLRGDVPLMRSLMQAVFENDRSAERAMISKLIGTQSGSHPLPPPSPAETAARARAVSEPGAIPVPDVTALAAVDVPPPPPLEPFDPTERSESASKETSARVSSSSSPARAPAPLPAAPAASDAAPFDDETEVTVSRPSVRMEPTVRIHAAHGEPALPVAQPSSRARLAVAAGGVLLGVVVVLAVVRVVAPAPRPVTPVDRAAVELVDEAARAETPTPSMPVAPVAPVEAVPVDAAPIVVAPVDTAPVVVEASTAPPQTRPPERQPDRPRRLEKPPTPAPSAPAHAPPAPAPRSVEPAPGTQAPLPSKLSWLKRQCPALPCTVETTSTKWGGYVGLTLDAFKVRVNECITLCAKRR